MWNEDLSFWLSWAKKWYEPRDEISHNVVCATSKGSDQPAHTHSLIRAFSSRLNNLWLLSYWLNSISSFWAQKDAAQARLSLHLWKCHIVWNHMSWLIYQKLQKGTCGSFFVLSCQKSGCMKLFLTFSESRSSRRAPEGIAGNWFPSIFSSLKVLKNRISDFQRPDLGPNIGHFQSKKWAKSHQNGVYHSPFLNPTF